MPAPDSEESLVFENWKCQSLKKSIWKSPNWKSGNWKGQDWNGQDWKSLNWKVQIENDERVK